MADTTKSEVRGEVEYRCCVRGIMKVKAACEDVRNVLRNVNSYVRGHGDVGDVTYEDYWAWEINPFKHYTSNDCLIELICRDIKVVTMFIYGEDMNSVFNTLKALERAFKKAGIEIMNVDMVVW